MSMHKVVGAVQWVVMVATLSAVVMLFTLGGRTTEQSLVAEGAEVYASSCQACHGTTGLGGTGPALAGDLVARFPDVAVQRAIILTGPNAMPSFAVRLTERQIDAVIAFTRHGL